MIFNSIRLENFGIIKNFYKRFDKNILVLAGENGEGKSTVLKAILLAVFDDYEGVLSDYINWDSDYFQVVVDFTHRGAHYESAVRYEKASDRTLSFAGKVLKGEDAKKKLKEIIDADLLKAGMLATEQEIAIVKTKPAERREYLKRIYDIEFKRQTADLENDINAAETELAKKTALQAEVESRRYSVPEKPALPFGKTDYDLFAANLEIERRKLHEAEESQRFAKQLRLEVESLERDKIKHEEGVKKLAAKIDLNNEKLSGLPEAKNKAVVLETAALDSARGELQQSEERFAKTASVLNGEIAAVVLERLVSFDAGEYERVSRELYPQKTKLAELKAAKDTCPACGQSIASPEHIEKRKNEIAVLEGAVSHLADKFACLSERKAARETAEKNNLEKTNKKISLQNETAVLNEKRNAERERLSAKIDMALAKLERLDAEYEAEECRLAELVAADRDNKNNIEEASVSVSLKIGKLSRKLETLALIPAGGIRASVQKLDARLRSYDDAVSRIAEIEKMEKQIAAQKESDLLQIEGLKTEIQVLNGLVGDWKLGVKILKTEFPVYVIARVIKGLEKSMNEFLKRTYPKYRVEVQDKKNALYIVYGPKKKDVSSASGFEKQIFSLSFMFAVSRAIGNRCLILDEVDSAGTDKNSALFYKVLGGAVGQGTDQIILVSHKKSTRDILEFDYCAEVITFEKGVAA